MICNYWLIVIGCPYKLNDKMDLIEEGIGQRKNSKDIFDGKAW